MGQRFGALRICKLRLEDHCGSLEGVLGVLGVSLEICGALGGALGVLWGAQAVLEPFVVRFSGHCGASLEGRCVATLSPDLRGPCQEKCHL